MDLVLREGRPDDAARCGAIVYEAFRAIAERHGFPPDIPSAEIGTMVLAGMLANPSVYSVVAEQDGRIVGSNFLDERAVVAGIGPITVDPTVQNRAVGRELMSRVLARAAEKRFAGVRLVQAAYHGRSLALYTKLGFAVRETIANLQGPPLGIAIPGRAVRSATAADVDRCNHLCTSVHGHDRSRELQDAIAQGMATVVERDGRIAGYSTTVGFFGHSVAENDDDLRALIAAAPAFPGPGLLLPMRKTEVFAWCLEHGLRVVQPLTLMTTGLYHEPRGAWLPSVLF